MDIGDSPFLDFAFQGSFADAVNLGVAFAILLGGAISIFFIFFGGIQFITSGGDEEKAKTAVKTIRYAIIGLLVIIFAVTFVAIIGAIFNIDLTSAIRWDNMVETIRSITDRSLQESTIHQGFGDPIQQGSENLRIENITIDGEEIPLIK